MTVNAADESRLKGDSHLLRPRLNVFPPVAVATGTVTVRPDYYPIGSIEVSFSTSGIRVGQMVEVREPTGELVTYAVVRKVDGSTTLYIDGKSRGDAGRAQRLLRALQVGQVVTVYSFQPLWSMLSRIYQGVFYKQYDIPYSNQGIRPAPVLNMGDWQVIDADLNTEVGTVTFDARSSYGWNSQVIGYSWTLPDEATLVSGATTSDTLTFEIPPGFYIVYCTITDNLGATTTGMRPVWVNHPTLYPAFSDLYDIEITSDQQDRTGRSMQIRVYGDVPESAVMPGAAMVFSDHPLFNGDSLTSSARYLDTYVGWIGNETPKFERINGEKSIGFDLGSPYARFGEIPMVSQAIIEVPSPSDWTEVLDGLGTPGFVGYYILKYHTTYLDMFDYNDLPELNPPRKKNWGLNGSTVANYIEQMGKMVGGTIGCDSAGHMYIRRNPMIEEDSFRNALEVHYTWDTDGIIAAPEYSKRFFPTVGQIRAFAFAYTGGEPVACASVAPGFTQGQAPGKRDEESLILAEFGTAQDKINRVAGHLYALANNPTPEIQIAVNRNMDIVEPCLMIWHRLRIETDFDPRGDGYNGRVLPLSVDRSWSEENGVWFKEIRVTFQTESFGQPGETYIINEGGGSTYPPFEPPSESEIAIRFQDELSYIAFWNGIGEFVVTTDGENYRHLSANIPNGIVADCTVDWQSSYVRSNFVSGEQRVFVAAVDESNIYVYRSNNILLNATDWSPLITLSGITGGSVRILTTSFQPNYVVVVWHSSLGIRYAFSTDNGGTWSSNGGAGYPVGEASAGDTFNDGTALGADLDNNGTLYVDGVVMDLGLSGELEPFYTLHRIPLGSITPAIVPSQPALSNAPSPQIRTDNAGSVYVTTLRRNVLDVAFVADLTFGDGDNGVLEALPQLSGPNPFLSSYYVPPPADTDVFAYGSSIDIGEINKPFIGLIGKYQGEFTLGQIVVNQFFYYFGYNIPDSVFCTLAAYDINGNQLGVLNQALSVNIGGNLNSFNFLLEEPLYRVSYFTIQAGFSDTISGAEDQTVFGVQEVSAAVLEGFIRIPVFYRVQNVDTPGPTWTDISPDGMFFPFYPYGVDVDRINSSVVTGIMSEPEFFDPFLFQSPDQGTTWDALGFAPYIGVRSLGDNAIYFGSEYVDISFDNGQTVEDITGNVRNVLPSGMLGTVRGVISPGVIT